MAIWTFNFEVLFTISFFWSPALLVLYGALLVFHRIKTIKPIAEILWAYPIACALVWFSMIVFVNLPTTPMVYRFGLDVNTPSGIISGHTMIEVVDKRTAVSRIVGGFLKIKGDAIVIDLGDGKILVALLAFTNDTSGTMTLSELPLRAARFTTGYHQPTPPTHKDKLYLSPEDIPIMVTFSDINNPRTMQRVYPNKLSEVFGPGYSFKNAWITMTNDPYQSSGIQRTIPWVQQSQNKHYLFSEIIINPDYSSGFTPFTRSE